LHASPAAWDFLAFGLLFLKKKKKEKDKKRLLQFRMFLQWGENQKLRSAL